MKCNYHLVMMYVHVCVCERDTVGRGQRDTVGRGERDTVGRGERDTVDRGERDTVGRGERDTMGQGYQYVGHTMQTAETGYKEKASIEARAVRLPTLKNRVV